MSIISLKTPLLSATILKYSHVHQVIELLFTRTYQGSLGTLLIWKENYAYKLQVYGLRCAGLIVHLDRIRAEGDASINFIYN